MDDMFKFKVPTLRNIEFSAPYMHDGRFKTLDAVLDHYTNLANAHNLDTFLINNPINLTTLERNQLKQFLLTLSDTSFIQNKLFHEQNQ
jgi:cytochrome c peroxidase